ncbi:GNAT family N-acetyltransferase [Mycolicibacterium wolinskyi]|uniref:GNAT family acetyltransferase n=1 Tax=Mycolicibacterium wolinskyi TaxID=59750 RepID=A0A1X2EUA1_9MYCO|nr:MULTISPECIES: GNAT family N-acetyltransferase [Mycolicibacterium]MCV7287053.1 GNAT family N-acetyltransferase [Mycolicibacterium wolinskyi]MCV7292546.1 GNAT family N-acetyltransferase [Mycolicibacterium goodii]ORX09762.1 GNAT family acetyltransferase [Mycolicibacterium wolinskyi]
MTTDIRVLDTEQELTTALNVFRAAMVGFPRLSGLPAGRIRRILEPGRTFGAFVDGTLAGTTDSATSSLTLPGGKVVGHAAVTHVGVLPSHTRRGIATDLLRHQLRDIRDRGETVATLRASEATIYGRFGYGVASSSNTAELLTRRAALRPGIGHGGPVRLIDPDESWQLLPQIYAANRPERPGTIDRPPVWWQSQRLRAEAAAGPSYVVVHGDPGSETGFARYHPVDTDGWFVSEQRTVLIDDFFAPTDEAYVGLLRFLIDLDLIDRLIFQMLPVDDPLPWLLVDRRAARITGTRDETWLRVVDVPAALGGRSYSDGGSVTLTVHDPLLRENSGTYAISAGGAENVGGTAQLEAGVEAVAAALLGGTTWRALALSGSVRVNDPEALAVADRLFSVPAQPHTGIFF